MMCLEEKFENHPFLLLISDKKFMKSMSEVYWEIRAEEFETGQPFRIIKERRLEELNFQGHEYEAAEEVLSDVQSEVDIGYSEDPELAEEWEQREIDAGFVRMLCRKLERRMT